MRVLVTGITGGVGAPLFRALARAEGIAVLYGLYRDEMRLAPLRAELAQEPGRTSIHYLRWDLAQPMDSLALPIDAVVHSAALRGPAACNADPIEAIRANGLGTRHLADFALRNGATSFLFLSIQSVYDRASRVPIPEGAPVWGDELYQTTKLAAELELEARLGSRMNHQILRLAHVYGHGKDPGGILKGFLAEVPDGRLRIDGDGNQTLCFLHIRDLCTLVLNLLRHPPATGLYNVASETLPVREIAQAFAESTRQRFGKAMTIEYPDRAKILPGGYGLDIAKIRAATGWEPRERLRDFVDGLVEGVKARSAP